MTTSETRRFASSRRVVLLVCLALALVWVSYSSALLIQQWGWDTSKIKPTPMWLAQLISVPLATLFFYGLYRIRDVNPVTIGIFIAYAVWFLLLFLALAPGCLTEDSYYTFAMVKNGWWNAWYSLLHPALMTAFAQLLPFEFHAPGAFLALMWAATYTLMHRVLSSMAAPRWCHVLVPLVALLPAQFAGSLIVIRDSFFTAFFVGFLLAVIWAVRSRAAHTSQLVPLGVLGALLMIYRTDAAPAVAIGLYCVLAAGRWRAERTIRSRIKTAMPVVAPVLVAVNRPGF